MKVAIGVQGRFHAFHLARALLDAGQDVTVFTNYPRGVAARWGLPPGRVRSLVLHGVLARLLGPLRQLGPGAVDAALQRSFGRWLARKISGNTWDVVHLWSGVAEECLRHRPRLAKRMFVMRGSAHIRLQNQLLAEEEARLGVRLERPSEWIIAREEREYGAADRIIVLSEFAESSFVNAGFPSTHLSRLPLAAPIERYRPSEETYRARVRRLQQRLPIRVLFVGALSAQKGIYDLTEAMRQLAPDRFEWRLVGKKTRETAALLRQLPHSVQVLGKRPERELAEHYWWADVFVFPSLQDGFGVVLAQAGASGLPILASTNCGASDFVKPGETGWIVPIRSPDRIADRLRWFDQHRREAVGMTSAACSAASDRPWTTVAEDFLAICRADVPKRRMQERHT